jgi:hypothetical protein
MLSLKPDKKRDEKGGAQSIDDALQKPHQSSLE